MTPDCTLEQLHILIQLSMGWGNCHMWEFAVSRSERYGADDDDEMEYKRANDVTLSTLSVRGVKKLAYTYDFGDSWDHSITFEKPVARDPVLTYPRCLAGERACPPEDCGGPWGYQELLAILAGPKTKERRERVAWFGGEIDPEAFDLDATNAALARLEHK